MGAIADIYIQTGTKPAIASKIEEAIQHEIVTNKLENITVKDVNVLATILATKEDISKVETQIANLKTDIANVKTDIANLKTELKTHSYKVIGFATAFLSVLMAIFKFMH